MRKQAVIIPFAGGTIRGRIIGTLEYSEIEELPGVTRFAVVGEEPNRQVVPVINRGLQAYHAFSRMIEGWDGLTRRDGSPRPYSEAEKREIYDFDQALAGLMMIAVEKAFRPELLAEIEEAAQGGGYEAGNFEAARPATPEEAEAAEQKNS